MGFSPDFEKNSTQQVDFVDSEGNVLKWNGPPGSKPKIQSEDSFINTVKVEGWMLGKQIPPDVEAKMTPQAFESLMRYAFRKGRALGLDEGALMGARGGYAKGLAEGKKAQLEDLHAEIERLEAIVAAANTPVVHEHYFSKFSYADTRMVGGKQQRSSVIALYCKTCGVTKGISIPTVYANGSPYVESD